MSNLSIISHQKGSKLPGSVVDDKPVVDYTKCIRCYCCHEMCDSKAISLEWNEGAGHELARLTGTNN
jgi:formate hydrogenlyase subunit 6/NADH:ubiquinone oxidoreductase subunit I